MFCFIIVVKGKINPSVRRADTSPDWEAEREVIGGCYGFRYFFGGGSGGGSGIQGG